MKQPDLWSEHHKAMRNPAYLIEGLMDCYREEQSYYMPYCSQEEIPTLEPDKDLLKQIKQLQNEQLYLRKKLFELINKVEGNGK